ncbi:GL17392 [Drosophila persimilis]|uniref:GL17392 n=1 Tax=Drosophila persimilis TaxID=7234 RepID=B4GGR2_DROPE|nr:GL17392 [Drosophila persimilis]
MRLDAIRAILSNLMEARSGGTEGVPSASAAAAEHTPLPQSAAAITPEIVAPASVAVTDNGRKRRRRGSQQQQQHPIIPQPIPASEDDDGQWTDCSPVEDHYWMEEASSLCESDCPHGAY